MVFSCPETKVSCMASSGWSGELTSKLKYAPGFEALICPGEPTGPARIRRWFARAGTVGLPAEGAPRAVVAVAVPEEKVTDGATRYPAPACVICKLAMFQVKAMDAAAPPWPPPITSPVASGPTLTEPGLATAM